MHSLVNYYQSKWTNVLGKVILGSLKYINIHETTGHKSLLVNIYANNFGNGLLKFEK